MYNDAKFINAATLAYYCNTNEALLTGPVRGYVLEFPGLGGYSCMGGSMDMGVCESRLARVMAEHGVLWIYPFPGPWSWMNWGAVRMIDAIVDAVRERHGLDTSAPWVVSGGSMGGMGALIYRPVWDVHEDAALSDLDELSERCQAILNREDVSNLDEIFQLGGRSGGARPKVMTDEWVIKFPASGDMRDTGLMEKEYMDCAANCGIIVPETKLLSSRLCSGYFSVRRFDREGSIRRHMLTAAAILETDWRTAALDYHTLMRLTRILSYGNESDVLQMYRRMCFNVFAHNRDDHAKNFSWIYDARQDCWHSSPVYDLTWSTTYFGEHTTTVDGNGKNPGMNELLAVGKAAGIPMKVCKAVANEIQEKTMELEKKYRDMRS